MRTPPPGAYYERFGVGPCEPPQRGIVGVTRRPRVLDFPLDTPAGKQWIYQCGVPVQLGPTRAGLFANIRVGRNPIVDLEAGADMILFDRIEDIRAQRATPLARLEEADHPRTRERLYMVTGIAGTFIPLGARRPDGSPHPHAGTGFDCSLVMGYPLSLAKLKDTHLDMKSDVHSFVRVLQFAYDGREFRVTDSQDFPHEAMLPGFRVLEHGFSEGVPSGDDLLFAISTGGINDWDSGISRWRRGPDGRWRMTEYRLIAPHTMEPTLVRDADGSLLMAFRPWIPTNPRPVSMDLHRSTDEGETWEKIIPQEKFCFGAPVMLNKAADGSLYVVTNRYREPVVHRFAKREMIWLWPFSEDRRRLLDPIVVRDGPAEFGPAPNGSPWRLDHPFGRTLRLADGQWRHFICYRALEDAEMRTDAGATPRTGCYVEELFTAGPAVPAWRF
jgi:hypothetical protein